MLVIYVVSSSVGYDYNVCGVVIVIVLVMLGVFVSVVFMVGSVISCVVGVVGVGSIVSFSGLF